jgi:Holliday junction resolvase RusA-like endonuclease
MTPEPTTFIVPGELISSKNSRNVIPVTSKATGKIKRIPAKSKVAKEDEARLVGLLSSNHNFRVAWSKEIVSRVTSGGWPVVLRFRIYRKSRRRFDYVNIVQNLLDVMVKAELLPDDCADYVIPAFEPYQVDKTRPRTEITIEPVSSG